MTSARAIVAQVADRIRWWANPPLPVRPTPALEGWTIERWIEEAGVGIPGKDERFKVYYPGAVGLMHHDARTITREAIRQLTVENELEPVPGRPDAWRAVVTNRRPA